MKGHRSQAVAIKKPEILPGICEPIKADNGVVIHHKKARPDLKVGDAVYRYSLGEGEGNKFTRRKLYIIGETGVNNCLYLCEYRGKYATYKECVPKADYRYGVGAEKAN